MHARNRTWLLGSDPVERCRQRTMNVEGGDGSTLSLDFTTGVLDPRLTFTRSSNATFINSQGYVEWANSNMYWNTAFEGLTGTNPSLTSSGWGYVFSTGSAVFNGDGTMTVTTTATDRRAIFRSSGFTGNGLRVVAAVDVTIHSGSLTASQVIVTGTPTNAQHYVNGVIWNSSHPIWNGGVLPSNTSFNIAYATDSLTGSTTSIYFGVGCTSATAGSATFSNPRWTMWKGSGTVPYYPNTSATNNSTADRYKSNDYQGPRFDYDPTSIGTPRGLLIEGSANNLLNWSETFDTTGGAVNWNWSINVTRGTVTTTNPTGASATVIKVEETATNGLHTPLTTPTVLASTPYTFSVWAKAVERTFVQLWENGGSGANSMVNLSTGAIVSESTAGITTVTAFGTTGWYRISMRLTTIAGQTTANCQLRLSTNGSTTSYAGTTGSGIYIWGAQLEAGSGASSYIPTGASTGTRNADSCSMTGTNFSSWFTQGAGTIVAQSDIVKANGRNLLCQINKDATNYIQMGITAGAGSGESIFYYLDGFSQSLITPSQNTEYKSAYVWDTNYFIVCVNGTLGSADTAGSILSSGMVNMAIGGDVTNPTDVYIKNGHIKSLKYWPYRLPNAQLQSLTT